MSSGPHAASFRDPAGYVVFDRGLYKRVVARHGEHDYERLIGSGLYESLVRDNLLVSHREETTDLDDVHDQVHKLLTPAQIHFISYPYEWCFTQLKDAALLTLQIQERAMSFGMSLKDASAFNVQFHEGRPLFIDTLSFEEDQDRPWVAYEQFCRHFLAPLSLMRSRSLSLNKLLAVHLDGVPLGLASRLLGVSSYLRPGVLLHVHLHARAQRSQSRAGEAQQSGRKAKLQILRSLRQTIENLRLPRGTSEWSEYTTRSDHYPDTSASFKLEYVSRALECVKPGLVYDLGGNAGVYSHLAAAHGCRCVLYDADPLCIEHAYLREKESGSGLILPLVVDLANPTPAVGLNLSERACTFDRARGSLVLALALVHHLRLRYNIPFRRMADLLAKFGDRLVVEFVGPDDPMARQMLARKRTPPDDYSLEAFISAFSSRFRLLDRAPIPGMQRTLLVFACTE
ncbi:MAG: SAM-dependent methyltransferase [Acidobacteria bacterium]|nr:SAM-dependent methyltransferase [Acidobacteriota bacterium]